MRLTTCEQLWESGEGETIPQDTAEHDQASNGEPMLLSIYAPLVTFLDPLDLSAESSATKALQLRDRDDVPTARIVELIHPDVIFSEDQDLQAFVTVAKEIWTQVAVALRDHAERGMVDIAISVGGGMVIQVSIASVSLFLRWLWSINRTVLLALAVSLGS